MPAPAQEEIDSTTERAFRLCWIGNGRGPQEFAEFWDAVILGDNDGFEQQWFDESAELLGYERERELCGHRFENVFSEMSEFG
ncbi:hypothetical protein FRB91_005153 [Serendipita sp. 411]|nr:hypothetical protein FRB91_005153 [Serendipita sp. 411]